MVRENVNAKRYTQILEEYLLPYCYGSFGLDCKFVQDNASVHTAKVAKAWLKNSELDVESWPAKSPDLNPIENIWGILARAVYAAGKQYNTLDELELAVRKAWDDIDITTLRKHVLSMPKRCREVVKAHGGKISY